MQRVLYHYHSQQFDTGSPKVLATIIDSLDRRLYEPYFLATGDGPLIAQLRRRGVNIVHDVTVPITYRSPRRSIRGLIAKIRLLRRLRIDLVHVNDFGWNLDLALAAALARIPVLLHVHNPVSIAFQNLNRLAAHKVVFVSRAERDATRHLRRIRTKSIVLPNAIDVAGFKPGRSIRDELGVPPGSVVIGTIAQVAHYKGIDILVETVGQLRRKGVDVHCFVAGRLRADDDFVRRVQALCDEPELKGHVTLLGSRTDVPDLLATMDVFVLPSRREPFGLVLLEAMTAGVPVVATSVGGIPEIVESPDVGVLVPPDSPEALTEALLPLIHDPERRRALGLCGQRSVATRFDLATFAARLAAIYAEVLGQRKPRRP